MNAPRLLLQVAAGVLVEGHDIDRIEGEGLGRSVIADTRRKRADIGDAQGGAAVDIARYDLRDDAVSAGLPAG